jgi:predicted CopG family antitoxin
MAVKTITIDMEAYETLAREKLPGESFSQVIKRVLKPRRMTAASFLRRAESITFSDQTLEQIEQIVKNREQDLMSAPKLNVD